MKAHYVLRHVARFVSHYLRMTGAQRVEVDVTFGAPILPRTGEAPEATAARTRNVITTMLERSTDAGTRTDGERGRRDPRRAA